MTSTQDNPSFRVRTAHPTWAGVVQLRRGPKAAMENLANEPRAHSAPYERWIATGESQAIAGGVDQLSQTRPSYQNVGGAVRTRTNGMVPRCHATIAPPCLPAIGVDGEEIRCTGNRGGTTPRHRARITPRSACAQRTLHGLAGKSASSPVCVSLVRSVYPKLTRKIGRRASGHEGNVLAVPRAPGSGEPV